MATKQPLIISDALNDTDFKDSLSVMNLRLTSVMCVPLLERGNLIGIIYVGNDNVAQLFDQAALEILTIFRRAQALAADSQRASGPRVAARQTIAAGTAIERMPLR